MVDYEVSQQVFEKLIEEKSFDPLFVTHVPAELVPLAKQNKADGSVVDVYELVINGQEISPGYSELNDPIVQRERWNTRRARKLRRWMRSSSSLSNTACPPLAASASALTAWS